MPAPNPHNCIHHVLGDGPWMRVWRSGAIYQPLHAFGVVACDPLVPRSPADTEPTAELAEARLVFQVCSYKLHTLRHPIRPGPGHRSILLGSRMMPWACSTCYPCLR